MRKAPSTPATMSPKTATMSPKPATMSPKPATLCFWQQCCRIVAGFGDNVAVFGDNVAVFGDKLCIVINYTLRQARPCVTAK